MTTEHPQPPEAVTPRGDLSIEAQLAELEANLPHEQYRQVQQVVELALRDRATRHAADLEGDACIAADKARVAALLAHLQGALPVNQYPRVRELAEAAEELGFHRASDTEDRVWDHIVGHLPWLEPVLAHLRYEVWGGCDSCDICEAKPPFQPERVS